MKKCVFTVVFLTMTCILAFPAFTETLPSFPLNRNDVNAFDRVLMQPYNGLLDDVATIVELGMLAAPGAFLLVPGADWFSDGLMYAETGIISYGARYLLKKAVSRPRPCMYYDSYPQKLIDDDDWNRSFPSGHTTMCFMSASFITYMFNSRYPDSQWKLPAVISAYSLAALTGASRVASGNHFVTDVLAGAALGTLTGYAIPWIHDQIRDSLKLGTSGGAAGTARLSACISPFSLEFHVNF